MYGDINTITISGLDFDIFEEENNIHMTWVNLHDFHNSASIGAVLKLPDNENSIGHNYIVPCAVDARWISAELSIEPATSQIVFGDLGSSGAFSDLGALISDAKRSRSPGLASFVSDMIKIDLEWAQLMNLVTPIDHKYPSSVGMRTNSTIRVPNATSIEVLLEQRLLSSGLFPDISTFFDAPDLTNASTPEMKVQAFISIFLSILITDALVQYTQGDISLLSIGSETDTSTCILMVYVFGYHTFELPCDNPRTSSWKFDLERRGYSYGMKSFTTRLALAALLAHTLMALIFIVYLCFAGWTTNLWSWGSIRELVALALISRRTKGFRGTDAGISRAETWAQNVRIVEARDGGLEMRFEEDGGGGGIEMGKRVQVGKKYGYQKAAVKNIKRSKTFASMP
ncbi:hypothetical protein EAE99_002377 [Botrytis elliptica]|nr:hypothetical protein EAE99_002377 [Botrytis elliptica]